MIHRTGATPASVDSGQYPGMTSSDYYPGTTGRGETFTTALEPSQTEIVVSKLHLLFRRVLGKPPRKKGWRNTQHHLRQMSVYPRSTSDHHTMDNLFLSLSSFQSLIHSLTKGEWFCVLSCSSYTRHTTPKPQLCFSNCREIKSPRLMPKVF